MSRIGIVGALLVTCTALAGMSSNISLAAEPAAPHASGDYLIGRGIADITGPPVGLRMLGYVRPDQIDEGIHLRQYSRAFVVAEPEAAAGWRS